MQADKPATIDHAARFLAAFGAPRVDPQASRRAARRAEAAARGPRALAAYEARVRANAEHLRAECDAFEADPSDYA